MRQLLLDERDAFDAGEARQANIGEDKLGRDSGHGQAPQKRLHGICHQHAAKLGLGAEVFLQRFPNGSLVFDNGQRKGELHGAKVRPKPTPQYDMKMLLFGRGRGWAASNDVLVNEKQPTKNPAALLQPHQRGPEAELLLARILEELNILVAAQLAVDFLAQHPVAHAVDKHDFVHVSSQGPA